MDEFAFERFEGLEGLQAIRDIWTRLVDSLPERRFFDRCEWYESFLAHLDPDPTSAFFVVASRSGRAVAIFPLKRGRETICGVSVATLELPHHGHLPFSDFIAERTPAVVGIVDGLIEYLRRESPGRWHVMRLRNVLEGSVAHYATTRGLSTATMVRAAGKADYLPCPAGAKLVQRISKNFKGNLRKARNKLAELSDVEFVSARSVPDLRRSFEEFLDVEASGWKGAGGTTSAIKLNRQLRAFYGSLLETYGADGGCEINLLRTKGRCLAAQFCLVTPDARHVLKVGYDEEYARMAPGNLLMEKLFERCVDEDTTVSVNLVTDADWHVNWSPEAVVTFEAHVFNRSILGRAVHWLSRAKLVARRAADDLRSPRDKQTAHDASTVPSV
jgi:CelD/BcsL family acetyltransferase involved in cellulose biosynthesis